MAQSELHIYIHQVDTPAVMNKLNQILFHQSLIIKNQNNMANELESLTTEVEETRGIMASSKKLIEGFAAALAKAGQDPVKLAALKDSLNAGSEDLAAAIAANPLPGEVVEGPPTE